MENIPEISGGIKIPVISDTAQWRQTLYIGEKGISGYLKNLDNPTREVVLSMSRRWDGSTDELLREIENSVYDNPIVMDDFSTDIIIETPRYIFVPSELNDIEGGVDEVYNRIYHSREEDIMEDEFGDAICLYSLCEGLQPFLQRTFPGARIMCHITPMAFKFREQGSDNKSVNIELREDDADFITFDGKRFLQAATHKYSNEADILYHLFNLLDSYNISSKDVMVYVSGRRQIKTQLIAMMRKYVKYVMLTMVPRIVSGLDMPLSAALSINKVNNKPVL